MALLTESRRAVWQCIDAWPELRRTDDPSKTVFETEFRWEEDQPLIVSADPAPCDFPTIEVLPAGTITQTPYTNVASDWNYALEIRVQTQGWALPEVEDLAEKIGRAVFQAVGDDQVPIIKAAIGMYPRLSSLSITTFRVPQGVDATRLSITLTLPTKFKPFGV